MTERPIFNIVVLIQKKKAFKKIPSSTNLMCHSVQASQEKEIVLDYAIIETSS